MLSHHYKNKVTTYRITGVVILLLCSLSLTVRAQQRVDTTTTTVTPSKQGKDTVKNQPPDTNTTNNKSAMVADTTMNPSKSIVDSLSLMKNLTAQQQNPAFLYKRKKNWPMSVCLGLLLVLGSGVALALRSPLCRDQSLDPQTGQLRPVNQRPYSYARVQLFWWTVIVLSCYTIFYFYTGVAAAFTPSMVLLLGGGLAVSMFGRVVDNSQLQQNSDGNVPVRHQDIRPSQGFWIDILSDDSGISIHRFQSVIVNLLYGGIFVSYFFSSVKGMRFPFMDFENWQLTLLGVSAGSYVAFKSNENSPATKQQRQVEAVKEVESKNIRSLSNTPNTKQTRAYDAMVMDLKSKGLIEP